MLFNVKDEYAYCNVEVYFMDPPEKEPFFLDQSEREPEPPIYCCKFILGSKTKYFKDFFETEMEGSTLMGEHPTLPTKFQPIGHAVLKRLHYPDTEVEDVPNDQESLKLLLDFAKFLGCDVNIFHEFNDICHGPITEDNFLLKLCCYKYLNIESQKTLLNNKLQKFYFRNNESLTKLSLSFSDGEWWEYNKLKDRTVAHVHKKIHSNQLMFRIFY